jgi:hypothetical protein
LSASARTWKLSGLGPSRGEDVDVDRSATRDCGQQQFGRGEVGIAASAEAELAAAGVSCRERAQGDALDGHGTARRTISYTHILPGDETVVGGGRYGTDAAGYRAMLAEVKR